MKNSSAMNKKLKKVINDPGLLISFAASNNLLNWMPDKYYLRLLYYAKLKKKLELNTPQTFNEKLQWLKLYDRNPLYTLLSDKFEVREYIAKAVGDKYLIPILGVWNSFDEINFELLPNQFVLKCTHDSGGVVICKNKDNFDFHYARKKINNSMKKNYYYYAREWPYKNIKPRIICEKYMVDESGDELKDYKFMSFNGEVKCSFVCLNRNSPKGLNVDFYDMDWKPMPFERHYSNSGKRTPKPKTFDEMVRISQLLSKDIAFVRIDFYEVNGKLFIGEITFYPGSGFEEFTPESYDYLLGSWIKLPQKYKP